MAGLPIVPARPPINIALLSVRGFFELAPTPVPLLGVLVVAGITRTSITHIATRRLVLGSLGLGRQPRVVPTGVVGVSGAVDR